ncbi:hypothetical protein [Streptomyces sp. H27-C3]|uniref:hypothetical protein n=1 Tax=Streptomyces sp. H27-C3 TaxID=3046305 RepID=UPI0024BB46B1|nr:hypothetical protein [Streptomyces sp. H27-C3]MDJ0464415.1 hypothetical protein [Streptomyces sp. H27-C3]
MKIQERAGVGNNRVSAPAGPVGERLPSAPRERKPALAALAVLLILIGALGATVLVLRAGERVEVVKLTGDVSAGQPIDRKATSTVLVAEDEALQYVKADQLDTVTKNKLVARVDLVQGTVLIGPMLTDRKGLPAGKSTVGLALKAGQYPSGQDLLKNGSTVSIYRVGAKTSGGSSAGSAGSTGGAGSNSLLVHSAKVQDVASGSGDELVSSSSLPVSVIVDQADAAKVAEAAAAGEVALVLVPASADN